MPTFECPTCNKTFSVRRKEDAPFRPFCSQRCRMIDLGRWLDGTYKISEPASPKDTEEASSHDEGRQELNREELQRWPDPSSNAMRETRF